MESSQPSPSVYWLVLISIGAALLPGCRSSDAQSRPAVDTAPVGFAPAVGGRVPLPSDAGLGELVEVALANHPEVHAAEARVRRMFARVPQLAALPDPKLKTSVGSMAETAAGRVDWMAGVEQALPFPGKLREMANAAGKEAEAAAAQLEAVRLGIAAQVELAYWGLYLAQRSSVITRENQDALRLIQDSVDARVAANKGTQEDQLRLAAEAGQLENALIQSRQQEASARSRLNSLLDRPAGAELPNPRFERDGARRDLSSLLTAAEAQHPSVRAANAELDAFRHRLKRARLEGYPDFFLGAQYAAIADSGLAPSANGRDQMFATVGVSIPLWQPPRRAMIDEANAGIDEATAKVGSARANLRFEVEDAWLRARATEDLITLFDKQLIPEAQQVFETVLTGFASGEQNFVDSLDAWRQLLAVQLQQAGNQAELGKAMASLRKNTGVPL